MEFSKLTVEALDTEDFLIFAARTDDGRPLDDETAHKLMTLPAVVVDGDGLAPPNLAPLRNQEVQARLAEVEKRNAEFFDEEVVKLDRWSDDLKLGLEREIKDLDKDIREARKVAALATSLRDKLEAQKTIKNLESTRNRKRRELYEAQDKIDTQRDELIGRIEAQLRQRKTVVPVYTVRWEVS